MILENRNNQSPSRNQMNQSSDNVRAKLESGYEEPGGGIKI